MGKTDLHPVSVRHSSFVTWKRFSMYSRLILSGLVNGNRKFRDAKIPTRSWGETAGHAAFKQDLASVAQDTSMMDLKRNYLIFIFAWCISDRVFVPTT